jgi:NADH:ubiquinone oxidoreductase subunit 3 (subunit A)
MYVHNLIFQYIQWGGLYNPEYMSLQDVYAAVFIIVILLLVVIDIKMIFITLIGIYINKCIDTYEIICFYVIN